MRLKPRDIADCAEKENPADKRFSVINSLGIVCRKFDKEQGVAKKATGKHKTIRE